jgi:CCDC81-like prokaryotic HU domain 1/CCDC81-like prokaryotic HU domain 2/SPOR domain
MRPVADHIRTLLFEHDYVTIPNFGAFIANYMPSSFNEISGSLMPPQKRVAFNEILKQDDGLLATHISRRESVTIDEAKRKIQGFVTDIKDSLATVKTFNFDKIGSFSLNEENNLVFDPDRRNNFYSESFGFDSLFPRQIAKEKYTYSQTFDQDEDDVMIYPNSYSTTHRRSRGWTYALYSLPILLLSSGLFIVLFSSPKSTNSPAKASFNPLDYIPRREEIKKVEKPITVQPSELEIIKPTFETSIVESKPVVEAPIEEKKIETKKVVEVVAKPVSQPTITAINTNQKRYLIVSGVFKSVENVEKLQSILQKNGFTPSVVKVGTLMKVVAGEANTYEEALTISEKHTKVVGEKAAIIKAN